MITESWMHDRLYMLGDRKLKEICIPGSHDSGMYKRGTSTAGAFDCNTLTQTKDIEGQLELGIRYFDIRPVISGGKYYTGHYSDTKSLLGWQGANGQSIKSIISDINSFASKNQELIILFLSHAYNTDRSDRNYSKFTDKEWLGLLSLLSEIKCLFKVSSNTKLTEVTINEFISKDSAVVVVLDKDIALGQYKNNGFFISKTSLPIYDKYSKVNDLKKMQKDQINKMEDNSKKKYFLLSWTLTQSNEEAEFCISSIKDSIKDLAKTANNGLRKYLCPKITKEVFPNIVYVDNVVDKKITELVIDINYTITKGDVKMVWKWHEVTDSQADKVMKDMAMYLSSLSGEIGYCPKIVASDLDDGKSRAVIFYSTAQFSESTIDLPPPKVGEFLKFSLMKGERTDYKKMYDQICLALEGLSEYQQLHASIVFTNASDHEARMALFYSVN